MEHIVQFAIGIDDEVIKNRVMESARDQIIKDISKAVSKELFGISSWGKQNSDYVAEWVHEKVGEFLKENKEKIIVEVVAELVEKLYKSKAVKEAAVNAVMDGKEASNETC